MVAPNAVGSLRIPGYESVITDNRTGLAEFTQDIISGRFMVNKYRKIIVMLGRYDILCNRDGRVVLEHFLSTLQGQGLGETEVLLTGPVPRCHDREYLLQDFRELFKGWKNRLATVSQVHVTDVMLGFCYHGQVIPDYINAHGFTTGGVRQFLDGIPGW